MNKIRVRKRPNINVAANNNLTIGIIGAGSWGTALAMLFATNKVPCILYGNAPEVLDDIKLNRRNQQYLPDLVIPDNLQLAYSLEELASADIILLAVPSHVFRPVLESVRNKLPHINKIAWATKGLEQVSHKLLHEVAQEVFTDVHTAVLSGPTFAYEVAKGLPSAITIASRNEDFSRTLASLCHCDYFRAYTTHDIIGVQIAGAVKNVLAIGAGISDGLKFGANARAALITRGLAEIMRLGVRLGADAETFMGLAGLGDLVLTCTDNLSRNRRFGLAIAKGQSHTQAQQEIGQVVEGINTADVVYNLAGELGISMPITEQVYRVVHQNADPGEAVQSLFLRDLKAETE